MKRGSIFETDGVVVAADGNADGDFPADGFLQLLHIHAEFTIQPPAEFAVRADGAGDGTLVNRGENRHSLLVQGVHRACKAGRMRALEACCSR